MEVELQKFNLGQKLYIPGPEYLDKVNPYVAERQTALLSLYDLMNRNDFLNNICIFGLSVTIFDIYMSIIGFDPIKLNLIASTCLFTASGLFLFDFEDLDWLHAHLTKSYSESAFYNVQADIAYKLNGEFIRSSQIFYVNVNNNNIKYLTILSYLCHELTIYQPSDIANAIIYLSNGGEYSPAITGKIAYIIQEYYLSCLTACNPILKSILNNININYRVTNMNILYNIDRPKYLIPVRKTGDYKKLLILNSKSNTDIYKTRTSDLKICITKEVSNSHLGSIVELSCLKLLSGCEHIIQLYDYEFDRFAIYFRLEFGNCSLTDSIEEESFNSNNILIYIQQIIIAIQYCHNHDIIHADIKPDNLVFVGNILKLIDFGTAIPYSSSKKSVDFEITSPAYRAPEIYLEDPNFNHKIDIWGIGCVLYFMITGNDMLIAPKPIFKYPPMSFDPLNAIFELLGTPNCETWPNLNSRSLAKLSSYRNYSFNKQHFISRLNNYYDLTLLCLTLCPADRPDTNMLQVFINKIL